MGEDSASSGLRGFRAERCRPMQRAGHDSASVYRMERHESDAVFLPASIAVRPSRERICGGGTSGEDSTEARLQGLPHRARATDATRGHGGISGYRLVRHESMRYFSLPPSLFGRVVSASAGTVRLQWARFSSSLQSVRILLFFC